MIGHLLPRRVQSADFGLGLEQREVLEVVRLVEELQDAHEHEVVVDHGLAVLRPVSVEGHFDVQKQLADLLHDLFEKNRINS